MELSRDDSLCLAEAMMEPMVLPHLPEEDDGEQIFVKLGPSINEKSMEITTEDEEVDTKLDSSSSLLTNEDLEMSLQDEIGLGEPKKELISCQYCDKTFIYVSRLKLHMRVHTGEKPYACCFCDFTASYKKSVEIHMRSHTGEKPYACSICDFRATQKASVDDHMRIHTGEKPFGCPLCSFRSAQQSNVRSHMKTHSLEKPFGCHICGFRTAYKQILDAHIRVHTGERPFSCSLCDYKGTTKHNVKLHMRKHTGEKPFSCAMCDFRSTKRFHVKLHMRRHTGEKPYQCNLCSYTASQKQCLKIHMRRHTGEKPFVCHLCDFQGAHKKTLTAHLKTHKEDYLDCMECGEKFPHKDRMKEHLTKVHQYDPNVLADMFKFDRASGDKSTVKGKPLECPDCDFTTYHKHSLGVHKRIHSVHSYACDQCDFSSSTKKSFNAHKKTHAKKKVKVFLCPYCGRRFRLKKTLTGHIDSSHTNMNEDSLGHEYEDVSPEPEESSDQSPTEKSVRKIVFKSENGAVVMAKAVIVGSLPRKE